MGTAVCVVVLDDMTPDEMLRLCAEAFEAIPVAAKSRKVLKKLGEVPGAYAGNGSHILAAEMAKRVRRWLGDPE